MFRTPAFRALAVALVFSASAASCASQAPSRVNYQQGQPFTAIHAGGPYKLEFAAGPEHSVQVLDGQDTRGLQIDVRNGTLRIRRECFFFCNSQGTLATIRVTAPNVRDIDVSMGMDARATGLNAESLNVSASMGAALSVAGTCGELHAEVSMGAVLDAEALDCRAVGVDASMGATADVRATESAAADASMGGDITVAGRPAQRSSGQSMGGTISYE